jgi:hypothetical protein
MSRTTHSTIRKMPAPTPAPAKHDAPAVSHAPQADHAAHRQFGHRFSEISVQPESGGVSEATTEAAPVENQTGLPDGLKSGLERLSGLPLDDVRVHYGSPYTDGLAARAFTQGTDIHVGAGEERHLGHEAWHVVQQKQGRVRPTLPVAGLPVNDDAGMEAEADAMSSRFEATAGFTPGPMSIHTAGPGTAAPIQMMPKRKAFDKKATNAPGQATAIGNIGDAIDTYHSIQPKHDKDYQVRLRALAEMDQHLHGWFDTHVTGTIDETPNGPHMKKMLEESQAEHRKLVSKIAKKPNLVPIDTRGMQKGEVDSVRQTWRSVVDGTGNLKIKSGIGEGGFKDRQQANIAKLLQHPTGRELVTNLSAPQGDNSKNVTIGSSFKSELKKLGRKDPKDSQAVPRTQDGDNSSMAFQTVNANQLSVNDHPVVNQGDRNSGPLNFNNFVTSLPGGTSHFQHEGQNYKTGQGVGSYVKMAGKGGVGANVGTGMQETVVPEFVTLGHELSHSERMMKGVTVPFGEDMDKFGFQGTGAQKKLWNNAEEYVNIAGTENAIRQEHGITKRQFHAGDLMEAKMPLQRDRLEGLLRHPLASPKGGQALPGYDELFQIFSDMTLEPSEVRKKQLLMDPAVAQHMNTLDQHIQLAQQNAPVNNPPVNNPPVNNAPVNNPPVRIGGGRGRAVTV